MKDPLLYLHHMRERATRIEMSIAPGKERFLASTEIQDAVIRNLEVIGEAAKRVPSETRAALPQLDWRRICGMRDVLIHNYFDVDLSRQPILFC